MFNLKPFPLRFLQGLIISHLAYQMGHLCPEMLFELLNSGLCVLDCIVQGSSDQRSLIRYVTLGRQDSGDSNRMIDVWGCFSVLTTLVPMLIGSKCDCL